MTCLDLLNINAPVVSVIGSGGKSTLLAMLARELVAQGRTAVLATTTHFTASASEFPLVTSDAEHDVVQGLRACGAVYVGTPVAGKNGKLGPSPIPIERLAGLADHVVVEADGSRCLPLKAHAAHEPVVPAGTGRCLYVVGASGFGRAVLEAAHRPELFCERAGCEVFDIATPQLVARAMAEEIHQGLIAPDAIIVNQAEDPERVQTAQAFANTLHELRCPLPVFAGSIRNSQLQQLA